MRGGIRAKRRTAMTDSDDETDKVTKFRNVKSIKAWVRRQRGQGGLGRRGEEIVSRIERGEPMPKVATWYSLEIIKNPVPWSELSPFEQAFHHHMKQAYERWRKAKDDNTERPAATD
jgi:hypothetical protein